jgi:hypothetical protein
MEVRMRAREKVKAETLKPGNTFRLIDGAVALLVVDPSQSNIFKAGPDGKGPILREDMIYYVTLSTGVLECTSMNNEVYLLNMKAEEVL